jgi:3alpha(or 20beta)-hydroxysteroid dehydrogenase
MGRLGGKVAVITGGARGQGAAEARLFVAEGAKVVIGDVLDGEGEVLAKELGDDALYVHHDVTDEDGWRHVVETALDRFGGLDVLVNNAGVFSLAPLTSTTLEEYRRTIDINQVGVFLGMKAVAPTMVGQASGSIVNISSVAGIRGSALTIAYGASKWAVRGMTKIAAKELSPFGVRVNSIHPGLIETTMLAELDALTTREQMMTSIPMGRVAEPDEVAQLVLWLASDESSYSTGAEFVVDGGMTA